MGRTAFLDRVARGRLGPSISLLSMTSAKRFAIARYRSVCTARARLRLPSAVRRSAVRLARIRARPQLWRGRRCRARRRIRRRADVDGGRIVCRHDAQHRATRGEVGQHLARDRELRGAGLQQSHEDVAGAEHLAQLLGRLERQEPHGVGDGGTLGGRIGQQVGALALGDDGELGVDPALAQTFDQLDEQQRVVLAAERAGVEQAERFRRPRFASAQSLSRSCGTISSIGAQLGMTSTWLGVEIPGLVLAHEGVVDRHDATR